jgi:hypothetical protein
MSIVSDISLANMKALETITKNPAKNNQAFADTARKLIEYLKTGKGKPETDLFNYLDKGGKLSKLSESTVTPLKINIRSFVQDLGTKFMDVKERLNSLFAQAAKLTSDPFEYLIVWEDKDPCIIL